ncbi:MAG TPA: DUF423 domain-containing protein [Cytophagales bacterium]|jgi:uncharacterized membrane protein YgdD (TMEM256/DUF423 family)|nr:DUF423 domain-containing protein [Cytophagales bacterium]
MHKFIFIFASIAGALSVGLGAFGAHALKPILEAQGRLDTYETAVKYQFYHVLALLALGVLMTRYPGSNLLNFAGYSFMAGMVVFSGSLYILCFTGISKWGAVTPVGGLFLFAGWVLMAIGIYKAI